MGFAWETRHYVYITAEVLVGGISVVTNGLVAVVLWKFPALRTVANIFLCGLVIADLLVSLVSVPIAISTYAGLPRHFHACIFLNCLELGLNIVSVLILLPVTLERFMAIAFPFKHRTMIDMKTNAVCLVVAVFVAGLVLGMIPWMGWHRSSDNFKACSSTHVLPQTYLVCFFFMGIVLPCLFTMLFVYISIFVIFREQENNRLMRQRIFGSFLSTSMTLCDRPSNTPRVVKCIAAILVAFTVCWLPLGISQCLFVFASVAVPESVAMAFLVLSHINSAINPFLYALFFRSFRKSMRRMFFHGSSASGILPATSKIYSRSSQKRRVTLFDADFNVPSQNDKMDLNEKIFCANDSTSLKKRKSLPSDKVNSSKKSSLKTNQVRPDEKTSFPAEQSNFDKEVSSNSSQTSNCPQKSVTFGAVHDAIKNPVTSQHMNSNEHERSPSAEGNLTNSKSVIRD